MRVKVIAPPFLDHSLLDDQSSLELPEGARLSLVLKKLKVPLALRPLLFTHVNYEKAPAGRRLEDGDRVTFFWPLTGG